MQRVVQFKKEIRLVISLKDRCARTNRISSGAEIFWWIGKEHGTW